MDRSRNNGNVLFIILIAVGLFAALCYSVSSSSKSGSTSISNEKAELLADRIFSYTNQIRTGITRIRTVNGCTDDQISFYTPKGGSHYSNYTNPNSPADNRCSVFEPEGGDVPFQAPTDILKSFSVFYPTAPFYFTDDAIVSQIGIQNQCDFVFLISNIKPEICDAINKKAEIPAIDTVNANGACYANGTICDHNMFGATANTAGKMEGCVQDSSGVKSYYAVLIAR